MKAFSGAFALAAGLMVMILWGALGAVASDDQDHSQSVVTSEKASLAKRLAEIRSKVVRLTAFEQNHKGRRVLRMFGTKYMLGAETQLRYNGKHQNENL